MNLTIIPTPEFVKQAKKLAKDYKKIGSDLENLKEELLKNPSMGVNLGNSCYKIRLANSSIPTGKSGGFRVVTYYIDTDDIIRLLLIYSKKDRDTITDKELQNILLQNNLT